VCVCVCVCVCTFAVVINDRVCHSNNEGGAMLVDLFRQLTIVTLCVLFLTLPPSAIGATANPRHVPELSSPPCCVLVDVANVPRSRSHVRRYRCWPEPVGCMFSWNLVCIPIGGAAGQEGGGLHQGQCGSEVVRMYNVCTLHLSYLNDWGCEEAIIEPCNNAMPLSPTASTQRNCQDECLARCPAAGLGCSFVWRLEGVL
jgi:hypothetical protein